MKVAPAVGGHPIVYRPTGHGFNWAHFLTESAAFAVGALVAIVVLMLAIAILASVLSMWPRKSMDRKVSSATNPFTDKNGGADSGKGPRRRPRKDES